MKVIGIKFKDGGKIYYFAPKKNEKYEEGMEVIVETAKSIEIAEVAFAPRDVDDSEVVQPLKPVIRIATEKDRAQRARNLERKPEAMRIASEKIEKHGLKMKLTDCEFAFDGSKVIFFGLIIAELAVVFVVSGMLDKLSSTTAVLLFYLYAILNGVVFSSIFVIYELGSIAYTFFITAGVFGAMSVYGLVTKNDMTKFGSYCIMALFGLIIASVVNIFVASSTLDWIISLVGVALFIGLTAWDTQKIKNAAYMTEPSQTGKLATIGALSLYLDFINLFLYLLRFFGRSND